jgi:hypothetical protein
MLEPSLRAKSSHSVGLPSQCEVAADPLIGVFQFG